MSSCASEEKLLREEDLEQDAETLFYESLSRDVCTCKPVRVSMSSTVRGVMLKRWLCGKVFFTCTVKIYNMLTLLSGILRLGLGF